MILILRYREASVEVMEIMSYFAVIERASIDEAYIDLTSAVQERLQKLQGQPISADLLPSTYIEGLPRGPTVEETVQKGTCMASYYFCFLLLFVAKLIPFRMIARKLKLLLYGS